MWLSYLKEGYLYFIFIKVTSIYNVEYFILQEDV